MVASGGAAWRPREELYGNIYDHMTSDFVYPNGVHLSSYCRQYPQRTAIADVSDHDRRNQGPQQRHGHGSKGINPYVQEHIDLIKSITGEGPYINQGMRVAESTMTAIMARESAYSGMKITWDMIMAVEAGSAAQRSRLQNEDGADAAAGAGRIQVRVKRDLGFRIWDLASEDRQVALGSTVFQDAITGVKGVRTWQD